MEWRLRRILFDDYELVLDRSLIVDGGYRDDETYRLFTKDAGEYLAKFLRYPRGAAHLRSILSFQNVLQQRHDYPCARILPSKTNDLLVEDEERLFFLQTFLPGQEPTEEFLDRHPAYFIEMGELLARWRVAARDYPLDVQGEDLTMIDEHSLERGLIHNDFHSKNSLLDETGRIFLVDFVDACQSLFLADLATSLFHLLVDRKNGIRRAKLFFQGYERRVPVIPEEIERLDQLVRVKLTLSIEEDLRANEQKIDPFIQSCLELRQTLTENPQFVKQNLLEE